MKIPLLTISIAIVLTVSGAEAQNRRPVRKKPRKAVSTLRKEIGSTAVVLDETLSVLRERPSLFAQSIQRMRRGRKVRVLGVAENDGVRFYRVAAPPMAFGWVQADSLFGTFRAGDEDRLARLVQASDGFDQIELAANFFELYPRSKLRPSILLLFGDLLEEIAVKLSRDANGRLSRREMAATAAPLHSYYLNFVSLDRYRKLGIVFRFNPQTRTFHYDGASWQELTAKFSATPEAAEAKKRLDGLAEKMTGQATR